MISRRFLMFLAASATAAAANVGSRLFFEMFVPYVPSICLAFMVGLTTAFVLNRTFVFQDAREGVARQAAWFLAINLFALLQTIAISLLSARWLLPAIGWHWHRETFAHALGVAVPTLSSYAGHRMLTFRR